jgi:hypothetical protein
LNEAGTFRAPQLTIIGDRINPGFKSTKALLALGMDTVLATPWHALGLLPGQPSASQGSLSRRHTAHGLNRWSVDNT